MLSYSTGVSSHWRLGLSAARHGVPLVLAGLGMPRWPWFQGGRKKLPGSRRALQIIAALSPEQPVISSDTGDLLIGNAPSKTHLAMLAELAASSRMLIAAECNSWPVCYRAQYAHDTEHHQCLASHDACYPNSGVLTASARTMLRFYDAWAEQIIGSGARVVSGDYRRAERWNDQAAVHRLYMNRSRHAARGAFDLKVDAEHLFSLQLWKCDGPTEHTKKPFEYCHERAFEPAMGVRANEGGTVVTFADGRGPKQRPFLVHSNGHHHVLDHDTKALKPLLELYSSGVPHNKLLRWPVVLVDSADHGACNVTSLGWLMNATHWPAGAPWLQI